VQDLNKLYRKEPALHQLDFNPGGYTWIDCNDSLQSSLSLMRQGRSENDTMIIACNFTPVPRHDYRVGAPSGGLWREVLNSDAQDYGGSGLGSMGSVEAASLSSHGFPCSLTLTLPPLSAVFLKKSS
jgi:1,4-alpha-glucan branching enzyme